jgi:uncharacterized protein YlbG (UPF0298 family)
MAFTKTARQGIVVWLYSLKQLRQLRRYGLIYYTSRRMKYCFLYVDQVNAATTAEQLQKLHFVRQVEFSHRSELDMNFGARVGQQFDDEEERPQIVNESRVLMTSQDLREQHII